MIVDVNQTARLHALSCLEFGQGFIFGSVDREGQDAYFVRVEPVEADGRLYAVRLSDGKMIRFSLDAEVLPAPLKVVAA
ncbi:MAG: hypothetical protein ACRDDI_13410 [Aeromonas veronii]